MAISNTSGNLIPRSDSRNPATTCRGITTQGRPCRRALASPQPSPASTPRKNSRQEAVENASLYCWQHKDQENSSLPTDPSAGVPSSKPRTSIDTLMDRLGVLELNDDPASKPKPNQRRRTYQNGLYEKRRPKKKSTFCCFTILEESDDEKPIPAQRPASHRPQAGMSSQRPNGKIAVPNSTGKPQNGQASSDQAVYPPKPGKGQTSWLPSTLPPQTALTVGAELNKPISDADEEGYIYMFWVTPPTTTTTRGIDGPATRDIAPSLLPETPETSRSLRPPPQSRSISEAIRAAQDLNALTSNPTSTKPGTLRLKIGRTNNIHRRMAEWTQQCSYDLTLIRYYPYMHAASTSSSPARVPLSHGKGQSLAGMVPGRKVPHVHRVERLIHLELAALRVRDLGQCPECGKEHREWFEVEAAKESLRSVDECIRRWISWAESH
ncbi:hypothetical protein N7541_008960 [Penicillium brevicompactum]|uniref:Bacteriophage T5 Orf172 DNA-binding domain-containing protein n=1 Tax=Penicillium brevicompactum TaxID=5074 RepID=A0A9W9ULR7_PENBR|nr:hypothetical protein N7541_008960 [Penicillium brevicompactum]